MGKNNGSKKVLIDERIEAFCQSSTQLLTDIHVRCSKPTKKSKRGRKKKQPVVDIEMDREAEEWDKELV